MIISYLRELAISLSSDGTHIQPVLGSLSHNIVKYLSIQYKMIITFNINNEQIMMETYFLIIISFWLLYSSLVTVWILFNKKEYAFMQLSR